MAERRKLVPTASQEQEQARRFSLLLDRARVQIDTQAARQAA